MWGSSDLTATLAGAAIAFERLSLGFGRVHRLLDDFYLAEELAAARYAAAGRSRALARPRHDRREDRPWPGLARERPGRLPRQGLGAREEHSLGTRKRRARKRRDDR